MEGDRALPHSIEAERAVLGGLMLDSVTASEISEMLEEGDFYREAHGKLFTLLVEMSERNEPTEMVAVVEKIAGSGRADEMGGLAYVSALPDNVPSTENLEYYARLVRQRSVVRKLLAGLTEVAERARGGKDELPELLDFAEETIFKVTQDKSSADWQPLNKIVDQEFLRIQQLSERSGEVTGYSTGFFDMDKMLAGLQNTDLVILAARPAMGKTALALNLGLNVARKNVGVGVFSLEMSAGQLATRLLCIEGRVDAGKIRTGYLSREHDWPNLTAAAESLYKMPIFLDDTPGINITQVRSKARRLKAQCPDLGLLIVDYIGLMSGDGRVSRQEQIAQSSRGLKGLAKELNVCVLALSQLNRAVEQRNPKVPQISDLRESGAIEQDADIIMFIYRDDYYHKESARQGEADVIIAKQRNGPTGTAVLHFEGKFTRFDNLARNVGGEQYV
jgi:replicative DNA helicase